MVNANPPKASENVLNSGYFTKSWSQFFDNLTRRIGGDKAYSLGGNLYHSVVEVGNIGGGSDDLISYTMPTKTLEEIGDTLEIISFGTLAANGNNKRIRRYFGSTVLFDTGTITANNKDWCIVSRIIRTADATQTIISTFSGDSSVTQTADYVAGTESFSSEIIIKDVADGVATNDITQKGLSINIYPVR
jgi:hypothetical protein